VKHDRALISHTAANLDKLVEVAAALLA